MCYPRKYTPDITGEMSQDTDGEWVKASDYETLRARLAEAERENANLNDDCRLRSKVIASQDKALAAANERVKALEEALGRVLGTSNPYPLADILRLLAEDVDHLLNVHDCDHVGHEAKRYVREQALRYIDYIQAALAAKED